MDQFSGGVGARARMAAASRKGGVDRATVYLVGFATLAVYLLIWPIWRAQFPQEIWPTEGFNTYLQDAAASGASLYPAPDSLAGNNYPPLSFYAVAWLGKILGASNLYVGRALSIFGLFGAAAAIFFCVRILTLNAAAAAIGAFWYIAIMAHNSTIYVGANDPQIAGEAIMAAALAWFLARDRDGKSATPALLLMVLGGFWKHNMIGVPLASVTWLLMRHGRVAWRPILISVAAIVVGLATCGMVFGRDFYSGMLAPRSYGIGGVLMNVGHLQWSAPALVIWASWAIGNLTSTQARFTALMVVISLASCLIQWTGSGVRGNAEFDYLLALGIAIGVTFAKVSTAPLARYLQANFMRDATILILIARLIASDRQESALVLLSPDFRKQFYSGQRAFEEDAARVAQIPGDVACSNKLVCRAAGKPYVFDEFKAEQMILTRRITSERLSEILRQRSITVFTNDPRATVSVNTSISQMWR